MSKTIANSKLTTTKLTDVQAAMLSAASRREDRCLTPVSSMRGAQVLKAGEKLITAGLVREMKAKGSIPRAVQRSLLNVIESIDLRPPKAAARRSCGIVSV